MVGITRAVLITATYLFIFVVDNFWLFVPLKPHHILGVKSPRLPFKCLRCQILSLGPLHIIENKEECLRR